MNITRVLQWREAGQVQRCHTTPHHGSYSVAEHSFQMQVLLEQLHPDPPLRLYQAILRHDLAERFVGDMPASAKRNYETLRAELKFAEERVEIAMGCSDANLGLTEEDQNWVRALDLIEFWLYTHDQVAMGNMMMDERRQKMNQWFLEAFRWMPEECVEFVKKFEWKRTDDKP